MFADLERMFAAAGRHADLHPLAGLEEVRRRGDRRRRTRAALAVAAVVILVLAGAGIVRQTRHVTPILPATTPARVRGMEPVGEPLRTSAVEFWNGARIAGSHVAAMTSGVRATLSGLDAATGKQAWTSIVLPRTSRIDGFIATPRALILKNDPVLQFSDPANGLLRWELPLGRGDRIELHVDVIARITGDTRAVEGYDIVTGQRLWSAPAGPDRPDRLGGMRTAADPNEISASGNSPFSFMNATKAFPFTDDRLIVVTEKGTVMIRDVRTGELRATVPAKATGEGDVIGYEGMVYTSGPGRGILATSTDPGSGPPALVHRGANEGYLPCGPDRLCVFESRSLTEWTHGSYLLVIDATTGRVLRETPAPGGWQVNSARLGRIVQSGMAGAGHFTAILGDDGALLAEVPGVGGFIDDGNVLSLVRDNATGRFTAVSTSAVDGRRTELGTMPEISGRCDWNAEYLTCPTGSELWTWRFLR
ncbi:PQQ-binding-like beta-propeller repeat protein [Actinoplanes sp. NPDC023714]|uniref:outer membrane protein assembly factor BamB family protein n=1 Tax=Actinoplanes sp. NPDC023714 TaxID=3154322 RepID=UPI003403B1A1